MQEADGRGEVLIVERCISCVVRKVDLVHLQGGTRKLVVVIVVVRVFGEWSEVNIIVCILTLHAIK